MTRQEMMEKAIEMALGDMMNLGVSKEELIAEAHKLTDEELEAFIEE